MNNFYYQYFIASRFFKRSLKWSRDQLLDYQNRKLIGVIRHAGRNVPYYRKLFREIGLDPDRFKGIDDMHRIPLLDKEQIRKDPMQFCAEGFEKYGGTWTKTSGSTGTPLRLRIDTISKAYKYAATIRSYQMGGYRYFRKSLVVQGYSESKSTPFGYRPFSNSLFYNSSRVNEATVMDFYPLLMKHKPSIILGYARPIAQLFRILGVRNLPMPAVRTIVNYGENLQEETVRFLTETLGCRVYDFYSQTENAVMAHTFPDGSFRFAEDYFYPEVIEMESRSGGELTGTSFYNLAMPLIRYRTRDFVRMDKDPDDGHPFRKLASIEGRMDDMIVLPDGSRVTLVEGALGYAKGIVAAQYIQEKPGVLKVHVLADDDFREDYFQDIEKALGVRLGKGMNYEFRVVQELEKTGSGKIPFMISRIK